MPLNDYGIDMTFLNSTYEPAAVRGVVWQDMIWGLPESQEGIAFVYNKDMVGDEYLPTDPHGLCRPAGQGQRPSTNDTGKYLVCNQGLGNPDAYHVAPIYFGHGVPEYVDDEGNVYLNTPEAHRGRGVDGRVQRSCSRRDQPRHLQGHDHRRRCGRLVDRPVGHRRPGSGGHRLWHPAHGQPFVGIKALMLSQNAVDRGNEVVALDIMKYFTSAEVQAKLAVANKTIPAPTGCAAGPRGPGAGDACGFGASLNLGVPMANTPFASAQWGPVGDATTAIWTGAQTPAEAMAGAQAAIEQAIADMK